MFGIAAGPGVSSFVIFERVQKLLTASGSEAEEPVNFRADRDEISHFRSHWLTCFNALS